MVSTVDTYNWVENLSYRASFLDILWLNISILFVYECEMNLYTSYDKICVFMHDVCDIVFILSVFYIYSLAHAFISYEFE